MTDVMRYFSLTVAVGCLIVLCGLIGQCAQQPPSQPVPVEGTIYMLPNKAPAVQRRMTPPVSMRYMTVQMTYAVRPQPTPSANGVCHWYFYATDHAWIECCWNYVYEPTPPMGPPMPHRRVIGMQAQGCRTMQATP